MDTTARSLRVGLIILRSLEVALAIAVVVSNGLVINTIQNGVDAMKRDVKVGLKYQGHFVSGYGVAVGTTDDPLNDHASGILAGSIINLVVALLTLCLALACLYYTVCEKARMRARCGVNSHPCVRYTFDLCWDIVLAVIYFTMFIVSLAYCVLGVSDPSMFSNLSVFQVLYTAVFTIMFVASAVLGGEMRHHVINVDHATAHVRAHLKHAPIVNERMSFVDRLEPGARLEAPPTAAVEGEDIVAKEVLVDSKVSPV